MGALEYVWRTLSWDPWQSNESMSDTPERKVEFASHLAAPAVISVAFLAVLWWTWGTWPDVLVDFGRELYVPWRLSLGNVLYRDVAWLNGPLSPYVNALWFSILGTSLWSVMIGNLVLSIVSLWLLLRIVRIIGSRLSATLGALTFITMFGFSITNYNFVCPYSHELTHGLVLSLAAVACFASFLRSGRAFAIGGCGVALGLAFMTKAEVFLALAVALLGGVVAALWTGAISPGRRWRAVASMVAGAVAPVALAFALFWRVLPASDALLAVGGAWRYVLGSGLPSLIFYRRMAGLIDPGGSLLAVLSSVALYVAVFGLAIMGSYILARRVRDRALSTGVAFTLGITLFAGGTRVVPWDQAARPLPIFMVVFAMTIGAALFRHRSDRYEDRTRSVLQLTVVVFALTLLARIALNAAFYRYGFVLAMPATIVLIVALVDWIPARLDDAGGDGLTFRAFSLAAWLVLVVAHLNGASAYLSQKGQAVSTGRDGFLADSRATEVNAVLVEIHSRVRPDQTLVVMRDWPTPEARLKGAKALLSQLAQLAEAA